ncbi:hypothetical protein BKI52_31035 [marine bacterium AO1-C]|nr:hypothetical protein BKI52_31035 [marine bacterium AO1-C]
MKSILCIFCTCLLSFIGWGQNQVDSLKKIIDQHNGDSIEVQALFKYADLFRIKDATIFKKQVDLGLALATKIDYQKGIAEGNRRLGTHYRMQSNYNEGVKYFLKSLKVFEQLKDQEGIARCYDHLGLVYQRQMISAPKEAKEAFYEKSLEYYNKVKSIYQKLNKRKALLVNYVNVGVLHYVYRDYNKALTIYNEGIILAKKYKAGNALADLYNFKGVLLLTQKKTAQGLASLKKAVAKYEEINDASGVNSAYLRIGTIYEGQTQYKEAESYYKKALKSARKASNQYYIVSSLLRLSKLYTLTQQYELADEYLREGINTSKKIGNIMRLMNAYLLKFRLDSTRNNFEDAFRYQAKYFHLKDSVFNARKNAQLTEMLTRFDSQKKENENQLLRKENELKKKTIRQQTIITTAIGVFLFLAVLSAILFLRTNQQLQKQKSEVASQNAILEKQKDEISHQNTLLTDQQSKILAQNEELHQQGEELQASKEFLEMKNGVLEQTTYILEQRNSQIKQSISAGLLIQRAVLPSVNRLQSSLSEYFVLYRPKDVVSGDFYWLSKIERKDQPPKLLLASVDCTGHGIPGAFMSMIGNILLDRIVEVEQITDPAMILNRLTTLIVEVLNQRENENTDGMDIALVAIEEENPVQDNEPIKVTFAGARRPLFFIKKPMGPQARVEEIKGQRGWIGGVPSEPTVFENQEVWLTPGDIIYLTSDGFADQNDRRRRNFRKSRLMSILEQNAELSLLKQQRALEHMLEQHMEGTHQRDDILIWGVRV